MQTFRVIKKLIPPVIFHIHQALVNFARKFIVESQLKGKEKLHLGCGKNILKNWVNIDLNSSRDVTGWNLTQPLPVRTGTVKLIFSEHFIEHISLAEAELFLTDCYRCLQPNGILRLSTPNLKKLVDEYVLEQVSEWYDVEWTPSTPCQMLNEGLRLWGHQFVYDVSELKKIIEKVGFCEVREVDWRQSMIPSLRELECRPFHNDIILEAIK